MKKSESAKQGGSGKTGHRYYFRREDRLSRQEDFRHVYKRGRKVISDHLCLLFYNRKLSGRPRLGVVVGRKAGNAVKRNRFKRILREVFRLNKNSLNSQIDSILMPRKGRLLIQEFWQAQVEFVELCHQAGIWIDGVTEKNL